MTEKKKKLPIDIDRFEKLRRIGCYYVDKTGIINELLYEACEVSLFTRPRRFGKSLNIDMMKNFFEIGKRILSQASETTKEQMETLISSGVMEKSRCRSLLIRISIFLMLKYGKHIYGVSCMRPGILQK